MGEARDGTRRPQPAAISESGADAGGGQGAQAAVPDQAGAPATRSGRAAERQARAERLAAQLRANLARRKGQARRRAASTGPDAD